MAGLISEVEEESPVRFWLDPGLSEYVNSQNPGFRASLKVKPEDFLVTELTLGGDPVILDNYKPPDESDCNSLVLATGKRKLKQNFLAPPTVDEVPPLLELVPSDKYQMLEQMAASYKQTLIPDPSYQINLGVIEDKQKRSHLHGAIKLTFPVLLTDTKRDEQGRSCVRVHHDPKYVKLLEVLTQEEAEQLLVFVSFRSSQDLVLAPRPREERTKIHNLLNILYGKLLNTKYVKEEAAEPEPKRARLEEGGCQPSKGYIKVMKQRGSLLEDRKTPRKDRNPDFFTRFVLKKRLVETSHALQLICDAVHCSLGDIKTQGIKDKSAITVQEASIKNVRPHKLLSSRPYLHKFGMDLGNCNYSSSHVQRGGHFGNHFSITLKDLVSTSSGGAELETIVDGALNSVKENGFVNYFGMQRMGGASLAGPRTGLAILRGDLKEAVHTIFSGNSRSSQEAKDLIKSGHYRQAMELLPRDVVLPRLVLKSLIRFKGDDDCVYHKALQSIPHDSCLFYMQSFCSLLWNRAASYRIREYGMRLVEGDLVVKGAGARWWEPSEGATGNRSWVHPVTAEDVRQQTYGLHHVVLPVLGNSVILPKNRIGDKKNSMKIQVSGTYRRLLTCPRNISWSFMKPPPPLPHSSTSTQTTAQCLDTVAKEIYGQQTPASGSCVKTDISSTCETAVTRDLLSLENGFETKTRETELLPSLNLKFELGKNSFATMLVREVMKHNV